MLEFGQQNSEVILLLHGGGLSWWNYAEAARLLAEHYHVVLPVLDGHADSDAPFTSIEENAARLISYIDAHFDKIKAHSFDIESRLDDSCLTPVLLKAENRKYAKGFRAAGEQVTWIEGEYSILA